MTSLCLIKIIILSQRATNLVAQFIIILLKVLSNHLHNEAKPFLNNVELKKLAIIYNNKKLTQKI